MSTTADINIDCLRAAERLLRDHDAKIAAAADELKQLKRDRLPLAERVQNCIDVLCGRATGDLFAHPPAVEQTAGGFTPPEAAEPVVVSGTPTPPARGQVVELEVLRATVLLDIAAIRDDPDLQAIADHFATEHEVETVGELWDWLDTDFADQGGMSRKGLAYAVVYLTTPLKLFKHLAGYAGLFAETLFAFLAANGHGPKADDTPATPTAKVNEVPVAGDPAGWADLAPPAGDEAFARVGDIVRTSYGSGPYRVDAIRRDVGPGRDGRPTFSMTLHLPGEVKASPTFFLNGYQRQPDGRVTAKGGDELRVFPAGSKPGLDYGEWCDLAGLSAADRAGPEPKRQWMNNVPAAQAYVPPKAGGAKKPAAKRKAQPAPPPVSKPVGSASLEGVPGITAGDWAGLSLVGLRTLADVERQMSEKLTGKSGVNQERTVYNLLKLWPTIFSRQDVLRIGDALLDYLGQKPADAPPASTPAAKPKPKSKPKAKGAK